MKFEASGNMPAMQPQRRLGRREREKLGRERPKLRMVDAKDETGRYCEL